jgi:RNA polymerase sigma-70 factor (ECF subfamily)
MELATGGVAGRPGPATDSPPEPPAHRRLVAPADERSFEAWYRREHPRLVASLFAVTGNLAIAGESVDEAFARALERWDRVGQMESPAGWVFRVALNVSRRMARRAGIERRVLRRNPADLNVPGPAGEVWTVVSALPRREREVIVLRHVGGLVEADIAACLGISRSTVSTTLRSAHRRLLRLLHEGDETHD